MPAARAFGQGRHLRPLLGFERRELLEYAERQALEWLEDPANLDDRFARSYLRARVMPQLRARWPAAAANLARAAAHQAEAVGLLEAAAAGAARPLVQGDCLQVEGLRRLDPALRRGVLRHWIRARHFPLPSSAKLDTVLEQALGGRPDALPRVTWPGAELRRYRDRLYLLAPLPARPPEPLTWPVEIPLELPAGLGRLHAVRSVGAGVRLTSAARPLSVSFRCGGERFVPAGGAHRRPLKKLLQEKGIVPWMRDRLPLIYLASDLIAVADLWISAAAAAGSGEAGWRIEWRDHPPLY